ncbi:FISUMP domain-containing protein [uncultured Fibrobacter sp.]|uniref:FISUMP domain-containing protein n=1 Tax=uncultured Fibrobacter sp. TaxID=261512 RepID=UPI002595B370|nr:FISUMP domain-containing protein [uncultured Fibrobacter sp.]
MPTLSSGRVQIMSGFSALPAGNRNNNGDFNNAGNNANFWSATENNSNNAYNMNLNYNNDNANLNYNNKNNARSVRCLRDSIL